MEKKSFRQIYILLKILLPENEPPPHLIEKIMRASSFEDIIVGQCVIYPPHSCGYIVGQDTINRVVS